MIVSVVVYVVFLMLVVLFLLIFLDLFLGQEGILVNFGLLDVGEGSENVGLVLVVEEDLVDVFQEEIVFFLFVEFEFELEFECEVIIVDDSEVVI